MKGITRVYVPIAAIILLTLAFCLLAPRLAAQPVWSPISSPISPDPTSLPILPKPTAPAARHVHHWSGCAPYPDGTARCISKAR